MQNIELIEYKNVYTYIYWVLFTINLLTDVCNNMYVIADTKFASNKHTFLGITHID